MTVALALRVFFAWNYASHNPQRALGTIPFLFESGNIAHSLAEGKGFASPFRVDTGPTAWITPLYPLLIAGIFRIFGVYTFAAFVAAISLNILASAAACIPVYSIGRSVGGTAVGAGAAWLWAIFPNAILLAVESVWDASIAALLAAVALWATLKLGESRRVRAWMGYGLLWGLIALTNATLVAAMPFLIAWAAWRARRERRPWAGRAALAVGVAALCCVPWTVRNYRVFHAFVPLRSVLGLQLYMGNSELARDVWKGEGHPIRDTEERAKYVEMGEISYMREKRRLAEEYMVSHPEREWHLISRRFVAVWSGGTTDPVGYFSEGHSLWSRAVLVFNLAAGVGALLGIVVLFWKRSEYAVPLAAFPVVVPWAYYLTLALPRYRLPVDPMVMLLDAVAVWGMVTLGPRVRV